MRQTAEEAGRWPAGLDAASGGATLAPFRAALADAIAVLEPIDADCRERAGDRQPWRAPAAPLREGDPNRVLEAFRDRVEMTRVEVDLTLSVLRTGLTPEVVAVLTRLQDRSVAMLDRWPDSGGG
ncbi:MAG: hypothetical protein AAF366_21330 [Pseudomonadota bacterium]